MDPPDTATAVAAAAVAVAAAVAALAVAPAAAAPAAAAPAPADSAAPLIAAGAAALAVALAAAAVAAAARTRATSPPVRDHAAAGSKRQLVYGLVRPKRAPTNPGRIGRLASLFKLCVGRRRDLREAWAERARLHVQYRC